MKYTPLILIVTLVCSLGCTSKISKLEKGLNSSKQETEATCDSGIQNRKVVYRPNASKLASHDGKITLDVCVNPNGEVVKAKAIEEESTIKDKTILIDAEQLFLKYRFSKDDSLEENEIQCGKFSIILFEK